MCGPAQAPTAGSLQFPIWNEPYNVKTLDPNVQRVFKLFLDHKRGLGSLVLEALKQDKFRDLCKFGGKFLRGDRAFHGEVLEEFRGIFAHMHGQGVSITTDADKKLFNAAIGQMVADLPFFFPEEGSRFQIPLFLDGELQNLDFALEKPVAVKRNKRDVAPYTFYSFKTKPESGRDIRLSIWQGTALLKVGRGLLSGLEADLLSAKNRYVGQELFAKAIAEDEIYSRLIGDKDCQHIVAGASLGGALVQNSVAYMLDNGISEERFLGVFACVPAMTPKVEHCGVLGDRFTLVFDDKDKITNGTLTQDRKVAVETAMRERGINVYKTNVLGDRKISWIEGKLPCLKTMLDFIAIRCRPVIGKAHVTISLASGHRAVKREAPEGDRTARIFHRILSPGLRLGVQIAKLFQDVWLITQMST